MKKRGFTLAEVLITLVIIGIIAAMTIPTLMNKTNEQETVVAVKKAYSTLAQAYQRVVAKNGELNPANLDSDDKKRSQFIGELFVKELNVQKICGVSTDGDCFASGMYKHFDDSELAVLNESPNDYKVMLGNGMSLGIYVYSYYDHIGDSEMLKHVWAYAYVDINGYKKPNIVGKDVFTFWISKYGILPFGTYEDVSYPLSSCYTTGHGCTAWVITKGNLDYLRKDVSW